MDILPGVQGARGTATKWGYTAVILKNAGAGSKEGCEKRRKVNPDWKNRELGERSTTSRTRRKKEKNMRPRSIDKRKKKSNAEESTA